MEYFVTSSGYLHDFSFAYYDGTEDFNVPNITYIGNGGFFNSKFITKIHAINATGVGKSVFQNCIKLYDLYLPSAYSIRCEAMMNCRNLEKIDLPNVRKIGSKCY